MRFSVVRVLHDSTVPTEIGNMEDRSEMLPFSGGRAVRWYVVGVVDDLTLKTHLTYRLPIAPIPVLDHCCVQAVSFGPSFSACLQNWKWPCVSERGPPRPPCYLSTPEPHSQRALGCLGNRHPYGSEGEEETRALPPLSEESTLSPPSPGWV